jgi:hypothetical protein
MWFTLIGMAVAAEDPAPVPRPHVGRLATVSPAGQVQNNPVNFFVDADAGTITIGGGALGATKKFSNVQKGSTARPPARRSAPRWCSRAGLGREAHHQHLREAAAGTGR